ncbi:MAG: NAD+ synthase [Alphaproteobacteria bacterium]|jgi:NAD+ synthase|nr:NAD+ synthase [Alphaproteobacteria bacterium]
MIKDNQINIALVQENPIVGNVEHNYNLILKARNDTNSENTDLIVFSELFMSGYPPEDLVLRYSFLDEIDTYLKLLVEETKKPGPAILVGLPLRDKDQIFNSVVLIDNGKIISIQHKCHLPNYDVFDEERIFNKGNLPGPINFRGLKIGVAICEDIWHEDVVECLAETGAELLIVLNGSPYNREKQDLRINVAMQRVVESGLGLIYVNQIGGQDELVFDGGSFVINPDYSMPVKLPNFVSNIQNTLWTKDNDKWLCKTIVQQTDTEELEDIYSACVIGLRDYVQKNKFKEVLIGLSGGIDSAIVSCIAVDALGSENVQCVMLPSKYTSKESLADAIECAQNLGVNPDEISIEKMVDAAEDQLNPFFEGTNKDITEENIQSRIRAVLLMALSNKFNKLLLTTGNKSEMAVGYATLYGDMSGAFNPIKDVYKTEVYKIAEMRNNTKPEFCLGPNHEVIPKNIITKAPTAELRDNQTDQDSLPEYDVLDDILYKLIEEEISVKDIIKSGHDKQWVTKIQNLLYISEYKRRQAPPGVKISSKNFGKDRRYPITNNFRDKS